jgi:hypothetical protein
MRVRTGSIAPGHTGCRLGAEGSGKRIAVRGRGRARMTAAALSRGHPSINNANLRKNAIETTSANVASIACLQSCAKQVPGINQGIGNGEQGVGNGYRVRPAVPDSLCIFSPLRPRTNRDTTHTVVQAPVLLSAPRGGPHLDRSVRSRKIAALNCRCACSRKARARTCRLAPWLHMPPPSSRKSCLHRRSGSIAQPCCRTTLSPAPIARATTLKRSPGR